MRGLAGILAMAMVLTLGSAVVPPRVEAAGVIILVETAADALFPADGKCSLRAAIEASNVGGIAGYCQGSAGQDSIRFSLGPGVPVITLGSALPAVTQPTTIRGNTGGAARVKLAGPYTLKLEGAADGSYVSSLVLPAIRIDGPDNVTIVGNVIDGSPNHGIDADSASGLRIGGSNPGTPDPCSGDCNLIINATKAGIYLLAADGTISGNFIGVDPTGLTAAGNANGIDMSSAGVTIGGTTAAERNVISGNKGSGVVVRGCGCTIQGNRIGTDPSGMIAVPNGGNGITVEKSDATIGGTADGAGNLISGNAAAGVSYKDQMSYDQIIIQGNRIGARADGRALGNGGDGILMAGDVHDARIGSGSDPAARNVIAYNGGAGVRVTGSQTRSNEIRGNSIHHNGGAGIVIGPGANQSVAAPVIASATPVGGTACANCIVDLYSDAADEGKRYEGSVTADGSGQWTYPGAATGPKITATATNGSHSTSAFSAPVAVPRPGKPDGRIRKGTGSLAGDDLYNATGVGQTRSATIAAGGVVTFVISVQNDGPADRFTLRAGGSSTPGLTVAWRRGTTTITAAVEAGTFTTPLIAKGGTLEIRARVKAGSTTAAAKVTRLLTIASTTDPARTDTVRLIVSVP